LLLGLGSLSCQVEGTFGDQSVAARTGQWVRTADGWERTEIWQTGARPGPQLHPLVVALGQVLLSTWGLVAFRRDEWIDERCDGR